MKIPIIILLLIASYIAACSYISHDGRSAFKNVKIGDTEATVIRLFGYPSVRHKQGTSFSLYDSRLCEGSCVERLWFENRLAGPGIEAWTVELDSSGRVIDKGYYLFP